MTAAGRHLLRWWTQPSLRVPPSGQPRAPLLSPRCSGAALGLPRRGRMPASPHPPPPPPAAARMQSQPATPCGQGARARDSGTWRDDIPGYSADEDVTASSPSIEWLDSTKVNPASPPSLPKGSPLTTPGLPPPPATSAEWALLEGQVRASRSVPAMSAGGPTAGTLDEPGRTEQDAEGVEEVLCSD